MKSGMVMMCGRIEIAHQIGGARLPEISVTNRSGDATDSRTGRALPCLRSSAHWVTQMQQNAPVLMYDLAAADSALRFSPFCWRARFAIAHKRLALETIPWRFTEKEAIAAFGSERVPVIIDQGKAIHDSWKIAEYLEAAYPDRPSLFGGAVGHGLARLICNWADFALHPLILRAIIDAIFAILHEKDRAYFRASREARFGKTLEQLAEEAPEAAKLAGKALDPFRRTLSEQRFLSGDEPFYADYSLAGTFQWIKAVSPAGFMDADDPLTRWHAAVMNHYSINLSQTGNALQ